VTADAVAAPAEARARLLSPRFAVFWAAQTATVGAEMFSYVALGWVTLQLTGSGAAVGAVLAVQAVPRAVLMLLGGVLSDRFTPLRVMAVSAAARAAVLAVLAALVLSGRGQSWELFGVAVLLGAIGAFFYPSRTAALTAVVEPDLLEPANSALQVATQLAMILGPAVAGVLVARFGGGPAFAIDAAGFALAAVALVPLLAPRSAARPASSGLLADVLAGIRYMSDDRLRRTLLAVVIGLNFAVNGPFEVGVTVLARQRWGGPVALGVVLAAFGLGSLLGAFGVGLLRGRIPLGWLMVADCAAFGLGFPVLGLFASPWPAAAASAGMAIVNVSMAVLGLSWLQRHTPPELIGRVMSVVMTGAMATAPLSYALAGALIGFGVEIPFLVAGVVSLALAAYCLSDATVRDAR
jgi:MFS family permease